MNLSLFVYLIHFGKWSVIGSKHILAFASYLKSEASRSQRVTTATAPLNEFVVICICTDIFVFCAQLQRGRAASELVNSSTESLRSEVSSVLSPPPEPALHAGAGASFSLVPVSQPISIAHPARPTSASSTAGTGTAGNKQLTYIGQPGEQVAPATTLKARS